MIKSVNLFDLDIDYILTLKEVIDAKKRINLQSKGSVNFEIFLTPQLREILYKQFGLDLNEIKSIPMRWIKGDSHPHIDRGNKSFDTTYLVYLTDSVGNLVIDEEVYPITKGCGYIFSEGLSHKTIGTGLEPRLLLGPMSESGIPVGGYSITADGATDIVYIQYNAGAGVNQYKINDGVWDTLELSVAISNSNPNPTNNILKIIFTTDITLINNYDYFLCSTRGIQFGSTSLNSDGTRPIITIDGVTDYPGLINNNFNSLNGFDNIYVFNLEVRAINGSALVSDAGWIGQSYFGRGASNNFIINCSSNGPIIDAGGGIIGGYAGSQVGGSLYIIGCSSSGNLGTYSGGIIGFNAGEFGGQVICESCWSTGIIGQTAGGIFGYYAGNEGVVRAIKCYSTGAILGQYAGGIYGQFAGNAGTAEAEDCYSQGNISADAGGIFGGGAGSDGGATPAINCYSSGTFATSGNGIYGTGAVDDNPIRCYIANGNWDDTTANTFLINGLPNPIVGTIWVSAGINQPYELNNMGYTPYTITNITTTSSPNLIQTNNESLNQGDSSISGIVSGLQYSILQISGGQSSSYGTISINSNTGVITTTSSTSPGIYTLYIRNNGSYNITSFILTVLNNEVPNVSICFPAGTLVLTDQGEIPIDKINKKIHTIRGKQIIGITESIPLDSYLICIERNSLGHNIPNRRTIITKDHKIMCDKKMIRAEYLIQYIPSIYKVQYNKEKLYNVLLKEHSIMSVNNLIVETMNPQHLIAKIYSGNYTMEQKNYLIKELNKYNIQQRKKGFIRNNIFRA